MKARKAPSPIVLVTILSIDAWNGPDGWTWNQWHKIGTCNVKICDRTPRGVIRYLRDEGYLSAASAGRVAMVDDQYNLVIVDRHTREPLIAVAYGEVQ